MSAASGWSVTILAGLGLVFALHHLGLDLPVVVGAVLHGIEHFLGLPLLPP